MGPARDALLGEEPASAEPVSIRLRSGETIRRPIGPGQWYSFRIELAAGYFANVVVDQLDADVALWLPDPGGEVNPIVLDSPDGARGSERLPLVAEEARSFEVIVAFAGYPTQDPGEFEIRFVGLREANPEDRLRTAATHSFAIAQALAQSQEPRLLRRSLEVFSESSQLWRQLGEKRQLAKTLAKLGSVHLALREFDPATEYFEQALKLARASGDPEREGKVLNSLGYLSRRRGDRDQALERYAEAFEIGREAGFPAVAGTALHNGAYVHGDRGHYHLALANHYRALEYRRLVGNSRAEAGTQSSIGDLYMTLGETRLARDAYRRALACAREAGDPPAEARALIGSGRAELLSGEPLVAVDLLEEARALSDTFVKKSRYAQTLHYLGDAYRHLERWQEAEDCLEESLALYTDKKRDRSRAAVLTHLARLYESSHRLDEALRCYAEAGSIFEEQGSNRNLAAVAYGVALVNERRGELEAALASSKRSIVLNEQVRSAAPDPAVRSAFLDFRHPYYDLTVRLLMKLDAKHPRSGFKEQGMEVAERGRARTLLDGLVAAPGTASPALPARREAQVLWREILEKDRTRDARQPRIDQSEDLLFSEMLGRYRALLAEVASANLATRTDSSPEPISTSQIQALLDEETRLLSYSLGAEESHLWVVGPNSLQHYRLAPEAVIDPLAREVHRLLASSRAPEALPSLDLALSRLAKRVLAPAADDLQDVRRLVVVSDGSLNYIPFATLPYPVGSQDRLVERFESLQVPSAAVLAQLRQRRTRREQTEKLIAVIADPAFAEADLDLVTQDIERHIVAPLSLDAAEAQLGLVSLPRLPHTRAEGEAILSLVAPEQSFRAFGPEARRELLLGGQLADYKILHFATHGRVDTEHPEFSKLVFALVDGTGQPVDGAVRSHEIGELDLAAELVVLSACETALGAELLGEGLLGLGRGFLQAGARRVVVSLWNVNDRSTAVFMESFYRSLFRGTNAAEALQEAQLYLLKETEWKSPYYWAPFVLQGDWK